MDKTPKYKIQNWTKSRIGQNPEFDIIPNGQNLELDKIPNRTKSRIEQNPEWIKSRIGQNSELDKIPKWTNPEWTKFRLDKIHN